MNQTFDTVKRLLEDYDLNEVADIAECSPTTLRNWMDGKTQNPYITTVERVVEAMGYSMTEITNM